MWRQYISHSTISQVRHVLNSGCWNLEDCGIVVGPNRITIMQRLVKIDLEGHTYTQTVK